MVTDLSSAVSAPSAFWSLTPLALSVMIQPSGSICGLHPRLRTFLSSSPFFCFADSLSLSIRFFVNALNGQSAQKAAQTILKSRRRNEDEVERGGIQALERQAVVRWLAFLIGLAQVLKLFASSGIPWTRAAAGVYFGSFVLFELVTFAAGRSHGRVDSNLSIISSNPSSTPSLPVTSSNKEQYLQKLERTLAICAFLAQLAFIMWTVHDICFRTWYVRESGSPQFYNLGYWTVAMIYGFLPPLATTLIPASIDRAICRSRGSHWSWGDTWVIDGKNPARRLHGFPSWHKLWFVLQLAWSLGCPVLLFGNDRWRSFFWVLCSVANEILLILGLAIFLFLVAKSLSYFDFWREQVLFIRERPEELMSESAIWVAQGAFVLAMLNFGVTMWWFLVRYNGSGTSKPSWTNWLG